MIDAFDSGFSDPAPRQPRRYDPVPTGTCRVEIVAAAYRTVPWLITDDNPMGECIALRLRASSTHAFVFADVPADKPWMRDHVARAAGIEPARCTPAASSAGGSSSCRGRFPPSSRGCAWRRGSR